MGLDIGIWQLEFLIGNWDLGVGFVQAKKKVIIMITEIRVLDLKIRIWDSSLGTCELVIM